MGLAKEAEDHRRHKKIVGIAPYLGDYGDLHTWLMIETKKDDLDDERITYPVLRLFQGGAMLEVSYHKKTDWGLHLMYQIGRASCRERV